MQTALSHDIATIAAGLGDDTVHVWLLDYRKENGRQPLKALLAAYLGLTPDGVILRDDEYGRPELTSPWDGLLKFNWSHSADKAIIAVARTVVPGIDIERIRPRPRAVQVAERFFHPAETAALMSLSKSQRERAFLQLWTGKEAVLKALGRGIAFGLERLQVTVFPTPPRLLWLDGDDAASWQLQGLDIDKEYFSSVAWRGPPHSVEMWTLADGP